MDIQRNFCYVYLTLKLRVICKATCFAVINHIMMIINVI